MRVEVTVSLFMTGVGGHSLKYYPDHLHIEPGVVTEFAIIAGLLLCLYGLRLLRVMVFVCGFLLAGFMVSAVFENTFGFTSWALVAAWIGFVLVGVAGGCVALNFYPLGLFLIGATLVYTFTTTLPYRMLPGDSNAVLDGFVVFLGGMLAWLLVRPFAIIASSLVGSVVSIWGVGYFAGMYPSNDDIKNFHSHVNRSSKIWIYAVPLAWWVYLSAMLVLFLFGVTKQWRDASRNGR